MSVERFIEVYNTLVQSLYLPHPSEDKLVEVAQDIVREELYQEWKATTTLNPTASYSEEDERPYRIVSYGEDDLVVVENDGGDVGVNAAYEGGGE